MSPDGPRPGRSARRRWPPRPRRAAQLALLSTVVVVGGALIALRDPGAASTDAARRPVPAPAEGVATTGAPTTTTSAAPAPPTTSTEVGTHSATLDDLHTDGAPIPVGVTVGEVQIDAPVTPAGVAPDGSGDLEVPAQADAVVWYQFGPSPGAPGSAVLAGHVDYDGVRGSFFRLADLTPGALVVVDYDDGSARRFRVSDSRHVAKAALPTDALFRRTGPARLHLITCGGSFDAAARSYRDNVVVEAVPLPG